MKSIPTPNPAINHPAILRAGQRIPSAPPPEPTQTTPGAPRALPRIGMVSTHGYVAAEPPLGAADTGGQVVYVLELAKKLALLGHEVDVWTRRFENQPEIDVVNERVRVIRMPCGGPHFLGKEYLVRHLGEWTDNALKYIKTHRLKYEYFNSHYWDAGVATRQLTAALGVPHIHTPHSLGRWKRQLMEKDFPHDSEHFEKKYNFAQRIEAETRLYRSCDRVVATTPDQLSMIVNAYGAPPARVSMIPPGYDEARFYPVSATLRSELRQRLGIAGQAVVAIGRLARNKGYDLLIDAFALVATRIPDACLYLAVGGSSLNPNEKHILADLKAKAVSLGLATRVKFSGFIADTDLADYYRAADVFVLSSRYEPFGMTAIEAMACGTPSVVTTHGGLHRAVTFGRHALYADALDKEDLGITIVKVLKHPQLASRLARMGAQKVRDLFTWTGIAQQVTQLIGGNSATPSATNAAEEDPWSEGD